MEILKLELCIKTALLREQFDRQLEAREKALEDGTYAIDALVGAIGRAETARADAERWKTLTDPNASPEKKADALKEIKAETERKREEREQAAAASPGLDAAQLGQARKELMTSGVSRDRRVALLEQIYGKPMVERVLKQWTPARLAEMDIDEFDIERLIALYGESAIQEVLGQVSGPRRLQDRSWRDVGFGPLVSCRGGLVGIRIRNKDGDPEVRHLAMEKLDALDQSYVKEKTSPRTWTSSNGKYTLRARLVEFRNGLVHLARDNNTVVIVPVMKLSENDRQFLKW